MTKSMNNNAGGKLNYNYWLYKLENIQYVCDTNVWYNDQFSSDGTQNLTLYF